MMFSIHSLYIFSQLRLYINIVRFNISLGMVQLYLLHLNFINKSNRVVMYNLAMMHLLVVKKLQLL